MRTEALKKNPGYAALRSLAIIVIVLGLIFRFTHLDQKVYWADESFTSLRIAGYTIEEVAQSVYDRPPMTVEEFQKYQHLNPEKNVTDTVKGLMAEEPQLTPLYFVMVRLWSQVFGTSVTAIRSFSAVLGSLAIVAMYWLCLELFKSRLAGWIGAALFAVSPFHVLYAQEARPYSLMTLCVILSSYCFLRSLRKPTRANWAIYCITIILGLYSHLLTVLATLAYGLYVVALGRFQKNRYLLNYGLSLAIAFLAFLPWAAALLANKQQAQTMTNWTSEDISFLSLLRVWFGNISRLVIDFGFSASLTSQSTPFTLAFLAFSVLFLFFLSAYSLYYLYRRSHSQVWLFVFSLIAITFLLVWLPDLVLGSRQSTAPRYSISLFLGIQLAIAHLFAAKIGRRAAEFSGTDFLQLKNLTPADSANRKSLETNNPNTNSGGSRLWMLLIATVFAFSILSCTASSNAQVWWHQAPQYTRHVPEAAAIINDLKSPLVVAIAQVDGDLMRVESLAHLLQPDVILQFVRASDNTYQVPSDSNILVYAPFVGSQEVAEDFRGKLKSAGRRSLESLPNTDNMLFRLKPSVQS